MTNSKLYADLGVHPTEIMRWIDRGWLPDRRPETARTTGARHKWTAADVETMRLIVWLRATPKLIGPAVLARSLGAPFSVVWPDEGDLPCYDAEQVCAVVRTGAAIFVSIVCVDAICAAA